MKLFLIKSDTHVIQVRQKFVFLDIVLNQRAVVSHSLETKIYMYFNVMCNINVLRMLTITSPNV